MAFIHRSLEIVILACRLLPRKLFGGWRHFLGVPRSGFLFRSRLRFDAVRTVKARAGSVHLFVHRAIDIGVMNDICVHARHGGVLTERVSLPPAPPLTRSGVAEAVVNSTVNTATQ